MSQQGGRPTGPTDPEDDWWGQLYDDSTDDTGPTAAPDSLDDRFASASGTVARGPAPGTGDATAPPHPDPARPAPGQPWWSRTEPPAVPGPRTAGTDDDAPRAGAPARPERWPEAEDHGPPGGDGSRPARPSRAEDAPPGNVTPGPAVVPPPAEDDIPRAGTPSRPGPPWEPPTAGPTGPVSFPPGRSGAASPGGERPGAGAAGRTSGAEGLASPPRSGGRRDDAPRGDGPSRPAGPPPPRAPWQPPPATPTGPVSFPPGRPGRPGAASSQDGKDGTAGPSPDGERPGVVPPASAPWSGGRRKGGGPRGLTTSGIGPADLSEPPEAGPPPRTVADLPPLPPPFLPSSGAPDGDDRDYVGSGPPTYDAEPTALPPADPDGLDGLVPDTVLEGARYGTCTLRAVSVRGDSARYRGEPRRDALLVARFGAGEQALAPETGMCNVWAARYISPNGRRRIIGSFSHGSMANALPMAIGAQFTDRHRQVVSMSGDGGFTMLMGDFLTLVQHDLPVKVVLFNNSSLGMVELEMLVAGLPSHGVANKNPDFAAVAEACGAFGVRVEKPKDLAGALKAAFKHKGPALVDVVTDPNALSIPPKISADMVTGFALSASKIVLDGGVGRMVQMARSNLRNVPRP
ncbi:3D-(3,5/4)-trihydroxycyclohexane-1,2-dione hydrolase [Streptomyces tendae]